MSDLSEVEKWLVDLIRVGASGNASGVVQLGRRIMSKTPASLEHVEEFRAAVGETLVYGAPARFVRGGATALADAADTETGLLRWDSAPDDEEPVTAAPARQALRRVLDERRHVDELARAGLPPSSKVLLTGPPGVGKSMTARHLAAALGKPLLTLDLAAVMSSYLGRSGQNLSQALDEAQASQGVILLDEFDAVAKYRDDQSDLGELKRLVNIILLRLDEWDASTLLVAATNHPELLDRAVSRRFDVTVALGLPDADARLELILRHASAYTDTGAWEDAAVRALVEITEGLSGSDLHRLARFAARSAVLERKPYLDSFAAEAIFQSLRQTADKSHRDALCYGATRLLGWSNRRTADAVGVSHPTVAKAVAAHEAGGGDLAKKGE